MLTSFFRKRIEAMERTMGHDLTYLKDVLTADPKALLRFAKIHDISEYRQGVPPSVHYAVKLVSTLAEDCGPCAQVVVDLAVRDGVAPAILQAIVQGSDERLPRAELLGVKFARACLARDPSADALREQVVQQWGKRGLISLGYAMIAARAYPTLKYALGYGQSCTRLTVDGTEFKAQPSAGVNAA